MGGLLRTNPKQGVVSTQGTVPTPQFGQIPTLTGLRAYAAVWVMLLHLQFSIGIQGHVTLGSFINRGGWAVDIFFVLSGFILSLIYAQRFERAFSLYEWGSYLSARFARIYPLHLLALAVLAFYYLGVRALEGSALPPGFSLRNLALNLSLLHGWGFAERLSWNYPSWSIGTEWFAYLVMLPILAKGMGRLPVLIVLVLGLAGWAVLYLLVHGVDQTIGTQNVKWGIPRIAVEFLLGYGVFRLYRVWKPAWQTADVFVLSGLVTIVALGFAPVHFEWLLAPAVCVLVFGLASAGPVGQGLFGGRRAVFWGERSYSIYMLHAVVQIYCNLLLERMGWTALNTIQAYSLFALQFAAVLFLSHLAYERIELPARTRIRALAGVVPGVGRVYSNSKSPDKQAS